MTSRTIGRYEIIDRLGAGGFATVFKAKDPVLDSEVAVKVLAENWCDTPEIRDRFIREAQLLRRIDSDRVITVHDIGELASGQPYFVMALADRGTLDQRLQQLMNPGRQDMVAIAERLAACISAVHGHDLIHRDIKPGNLLIAASRGRADELTQTGLLATNERLVLGDFGLAKDVALHNSGLTITAGTGGYAAPEQMIPGGSPDRSTDLYAATGVMYRVVTGQIPPGYDVPTERVPFDQADPWMSGETGQFFRQGMSYHQAHRHRSVDEWLRHAVSVLGSGGSGPVDLGATVAAAPPLNPPSSSGNQAWAPPAATPPPAADVGPSTPPPSFTPPSISQPATPAAESRPVVPPPPTPPVGAPPVSVPVVKVDSPSDSPSYSPPPSWSAPQPLVSSASGTASRIPSPTGPISRPTTPHAAGATPADRGPTPVTRARRGPGPVGVVIALAAVAAVVVGVWYAAFRPSGPEIVGPDTLLAGEAATYTAVLDGADGFRWTDWANGTEDGESFTVRATVPGSLTFSVVGLTDGEASASTEKSITIEPNPDGPQIVGPETVTVGETAVYSVGGSGWSNPRWRDGNSSDDLVGAEYTITARVAGSFRVILIVDDGDGNAIGTSRTIEIVN